MDALLRATLDHLGRLVAYDTRNPPRAITADGIFSYLQTQLPGFACQLIDHGDGAFSLHAVRGRPRVLWNVHLDTVPDSSAWTVNPLTLTLTPNKAIGLGVCDIKGAAAGILAAVNASTGDAGLLFTCDEENNDARAVNAFVKRGFAYKAVIVAEPTQCQPVISHRGICSLRVRFDGQAGHGSSALTSERSAVHKALSWGAQALRLVAGYNEREYDGLRGLRFNIGTMEGGIKGNVIAPKAELRCSLRPLPSMSINEILNQLANLTDQSPAIDLTFRGPCLPALAGQEGMRQGATARRLAQALERPLGKAVDFWTEAALFSAAGYPSFVFGPGDIQQAHSADESIEIDQLACYTGTVHRLLSRYTAFE